MLPTALPELKRKFANSPNDEWAFNGTRSVFRWTHGYHRYPAKFVPLLVKKLIESYANSDAIIADVFAGCGTTLVESKIHGIKSVGVDINPVAQLITKAKTNPINPKELLDESNWIISRIAYYDMDVQYFEGVHPKIDYWFDELSKNKIAYLFNLIDECESELIKNFFLCACKLPLF